MKNLLLVLTLLVSGSAYAGPWQVLFQDIKVPSQKVLDHDAYATPIASSNSVAKVDAALTNGSVTTISSFAAQPDYPRNLILVPTGTTASIGAGTAVVTGLNTLGAVISENFTIGSAQSSAVTGNKAFKKITSVSFPAASGAGATLSIGVGSKLGIRRCMNNAGEYVFSELNGVYDGTRGTMAVDSTHVESNTFTPNGSMDGTKPVDIFYVQNYRCY